MSRFSRCYWIYVLLGYLFFASIANATIDTDDLARREGIKLESNCLVTVQKPRSEHETGKPYGVQLAMKMHLYSCVEKDNVQAQERRVRFDVTKVLKPEQLEATGYDVFTDGEEKISKIVHGTDTPDALSYIGSKIIDIPDALWLIVEAIIYIDSNPITEEIKLYRTYQKKNKWRSRNDWSDNWVFVETVFSLSAALLKHGVVYTLYEMDSDTWPPSSYISCRQVVMSSRHFFMPWTDWSKPQEVFFKTTFFEVQSSYDGFESQALYADPNGEVRASSLSCDSYLGGNVYRGDGKLCQIGVSLSSQHPVTIVFDRY